MISAVVRWIALVYFGVLLMAVGPLVPWRKANLERLRARLLWPLVIAITAALGVIFFLPASHWTAPTGAGIAFFALANLITEFSRAIRQRRLQLKEPLPRACVKTVLGNRRHYGGMIVHFGIVVIALGLVGSGLFRSEASVNMAPGDEVVVAGERLRFEGVTPKRGQNYSAIQGRLTLLNSGRDVLPERRQYMRQEAPMTESGIDSTLLRDVYVAMAESTSEGRWAVHVYVNPLVQLIWIGGVIILSGLFLSLSGRRRASESKDVDKAVQPAK